MVAGLALALTLLPLQTVLPVVTSAVWQPARPDYVWAFPRDHWSHDEYRTEWWYFTGHLTNEDGSRRFGYQFTFFRIGLAPDVPEWSSQWTTSNLIMGHASISDLDDEAHRFSEVLWRETPLLGEFLAVPAWPVGETAPAARMSGSIAWSLAPAGTPGRWTLDWNGTGFDVSMRDDRRGMSFDLQTTPVKPLVFQGPNGFSRKGDAPTAASQYYSFTRLDTRGSLSLDGDTWSVRGTSWMDKEFGSNQLTGDQVGWDWFSLQLDDGRELMLYLLRRRDGAIDFARGTAIDGNGVARYLDSETWTVRALDTWKSSRTGAVYPMRWTVEVPTLGIDVEIRPLFEAQENLSQKAGGIHYWEGAVELVGHGSTIVGRGYVELTGYGPGNRPPI